MNRGRLVIAEATVTRGFTTVRATGGDITGLGRAIDSGLRDGPRMVRAGRAISQTGGHGDFTPNAPGGDLADTTLCACEVHGNRLGHVADGPDAVRKAIRTELRAGSDFIKIMSSGGVASPTDSFDAVQYTPDEVRAATIETDHRNTYTTAHACQPEAISQAIENGVRCIEHGNLIDKPIAARMAELGATMAPTLVNYAAMSEIGAKKGLPQRNLDKNDGVFEKGRASVATAKEAGADLGSSPPLPIPTRRSTRWSLVAESSSIDWVGPGPTPRSELLPGAGCVDRPASRRARAP